MGLEMTMASAQADRVDQNLQSSTVSYIHRELSGTESASTPTYAIRLGLPGQVHRAATPAIDPLERLVPIPLDACALRDRQERDYVDQHGYKTTRAIVKRGVYYRRGYQNYRKDPQVNRRDINIYSPIRQERQKHSRRKYMERLLSKTYKKVAKRLQVLK